MKRLVVTKSNQLDYLEDVLENYPKFMWNNNPTDAAVSEALRFEILSKLKRIKMSGG